MKYGEGRAQSWTADCSAGLQGDSKILVSIVNNSGYYRRDFPGAYRGQVIRRGPCEQLKRPWSEA